MKRLRTLIDRIDPVFVSGHLAWSTYGGEYLNDLLPLPYSEETLRLIEPCIHQVQDLLGRPYLIENPASYLGFRTSRMSESEFLCELVCRTGCGLLCDVSNAYVSAHNLGYDAYAYIDSLPADAITEIHLAGFTPEEDEANPGNELFIDAHASTIAEPVWELYAHAIQRFGAHPTLIEWDNDIPPFATLLGEAVRADNVAAGAMAQEASCAQAR